MVAHVRGFCLGLLVSYTVVWGSCFFVSQLKLFRDFDCVRRSSTVPTALRIHTAVMSLRSAMRGLHPFHRDHVRRDPGLRILYDRIQVDPVVRAILPITLITGDPF